MSAVALSQTKMDGGVGGLSLSAPPLLVKHCRSSARIDLTGVERVCVCAEVGVEGRARRERQLAL